MIFQRLSVKDFCCCCIFNFFFWSDGELFRRACCLVACYSIEYVTIYSVLSTLLDLDRKKKPSEFVHISYFCIRWFKMVSDEQSNLHWNLNRNIKCQQFIFVYIVNRTVIRLHFGIFRTVTLWNNNRAIFRNQIVIGIRAENKTCKSKSNPPGVC